jgi:hypothetical protein
MPKPDNETIRKLQNDITNEHKRKKSSTKNWQIKFNSTLKR